MTAERVPRSLAVLATMPGREKSLALVLEALRPQVVQLRVICHDMSEPPTCVRRFADQWICEPDKRGSAAKLHWARDWVGLYLGCDDDFLYPEDYAATMLRWVKRWKGRALVTIHGRRFARDGRDYMKPEFHAWPVGSNDGEWVNFPGAAGLAFDTRLRVPVDIPEKNQEEAYLAIWAQRERVPIWLIPKKKKWLRWLLPEHAPGAPTIWDQEKANGYEVRHRLIGQVVDGGGWSLYNAA